MAKDTYTVVSPAGPWAAGDVVEKDEFDKHAFSEKFLRTGAVVKTADAPKAADAEDNAAKAAALQAKIGELQAELAALQGAPAEPTAPAQVAYDIDPENPPTAKEAAATRAEGNEVVQPGPGDVHLGEVVPGEAADKKAKGK